MVAKKKRTAVVLDTNVFIRSFLSRAKNGPSKRVVRLWLVEKRLQLVISPEILAEYLESGDLIRALPCQSSIPDPSIDS
jgi:predicted nucleic acid-binding protein